MNVEIAASLLVAAVGLMGALVAWVGHRVLRSNAELAAHISSENAKLATSLEATKQLAQNRQEWINQLRNDMATFFSLTLETDFSKYDYRTAYEVGARIELRMKPQDPDYEKLREAMHDCTVTDNKQALIDGREQYIEVCQGILKREWEVLKKELRDLPSYSNALKST